MITFKNIKISKQVFDSGLPLPTIYFEDESGNDWYTVRDEQWKGENYFIAVGVDGFINTWSENPNFLTLSEGVSVYEISPTKLPDDIGKTLYTYVNGKFLKYSPPALEVAQQQRNTLLAIASAAIESLQDAVDVDDASDEELILWKAWKQYRLALNRLDLSSAPDIEWPVMPESLKEQ